MAELDQNYEVEQVREQEYDPEQEVVLEHENAVEHAHGNEVELAHVNEVELAHEIEVEHAPEIEVEHVYESEVKHVHEDEVGHANENEKENEPEDVIPEDSHPDVKQNHADEPVSGGIDKWPGWPGESIFRMLVPAQKVGSIIGRKGEYIKKTCEETKARIQILDGPPGTRERAVMVSAKEEPDSPLPPAVDGLLRVLRRVVDGLENDSSEPPSGSGGKVSTRLLVPAPQAGSLIGKQGATVKSIQEESNCIVRVLGSVPSQHLHGRFQMDHMPPPQHWGPPPQHPHGGPAYGSSPHFMPPQQFDNYYPPADMGRPIEKPTHQGISAYGREAPVPMHSSAGQAASSVITQLTQQMQIPLTYADAVIGTQGASISYIRRVSGATVAIQETRGLPGEMTVDISGTASQVQTAQQLIQNFMAEAAGAAQTQQQQQQAPSADYNAYGSYASNPASNPPSQSGGYGPVYGNSYGY